MLKLTIRVSELWDKEKEEFLYEEVELEFEHSLVSMSKWESKHEKPFLTPGEKTTEEVMDYVEAMILTPNYPPGVVSHFEQEDFDAIQIYINAKMSGTTVKEHKTSSTSREIVSSEVIYYWMTSYRIPWEAQHWHLERLLTLIRVFNAKNEKPRKRSAQEMMEERRALNEQRRKAAGTTG